MGAAVLIAVVTRLATYGLFGYLCGMWLSDHIFADLALTHWTNIWVYVWLALWPIALFVYFVAWAGRLIVALVLIAALVVAAGLLWSKTSDWMGR